MNSSYMVIPGVLNMQKDLIMPSAEADLNVFFRILIYQ